MVVYRNSRSIFSWPYSSMGSGLCHVFARSSPMGRGIFVILQPTPPRGVDCYPRGAIWRMTATRSKHTTTGKKDLMAYLKRKFKMLKFRWRMFRYSFKWRIIQARLNFIHRIRSFILSYKAGRVCEDSVLNALRYAIKMDRHFSKKIKKPPFLS